LNPRCTLQRGTHLMQPKFKILLASLKQLE
jgi:hypothetical protein